MLNGLDLFTGIGGFTLALDPWVRPVAYCEQDPFAISVLLSRMANNQLPRAPIWDDVKTLSAKEFGATEIDIITGGFPCQDLSVAGSGQGLAGKRSGLYREVIRLADELRPGFVFLENVPGIRTKGAETVVGDLAALGYDARWTVTQAVEVGAIHSRERWWCLARRREWRQPAFSFANTHRESIRVESIRVESEREQCEPPQRGNVVAAIPPGAVGDNLAHTDCSRQSGHSSKHDHNGSEPHRDNANGQIAATYWETESPPEPTLQFMDDGLSSRLASLRAIGNSIVPQQARRAFRVLIGLDPALPHSAKATRNPRRTA